MFKVRGCDSDSLLDVSSCVEDDDLPEGIGFSVAEVRFVLAGDGVSVGNSHAQ